MFIAALLIIAKGRNNPSVLKQIDKQNVVQPYNGIFGYKKE